MEVADFFLIFFSDLFFENLIFLDGFWNFIFFSEIFRFFSENLKFSDFSDFFRFFLKIWNFQIFSDFFRFFFWKSEIFRFSLIFSCFFWESEIFRFFLIFSDFFLKSDFQIFSEIWNFQIFFFWIFHIFWKSEIFRFFMFFFNFFLKIWNFQKFSEFFTFFLKIWNFQIFFWIFQIFSENIIFNLNLNLIKIWNFQNFSDLHHSWSVDVHGKSPRALVKNVWQQRRKKMSERKHVVWNIFFVFFDAWVNVFRPSASVRSKGLDHWDCFSWFSYVILLQTPFLGSTVYIQGPCQVADGMIMTDRFGCWVNLDFSLSAIELH